MKMENPKEEPHGETEKTISMTQIEVYQRDTSPSRNNENNTITKPYKTGYNQHASPLDRTLSIVRRGNNRIISKVYIDRGG
jgi:hypothetical protein